MTALDTPERPILGRLKERLEQAYEELGQLGYAYEGEDQWQLCDDIMGMIELIKVLL